MKYRFKSLAGKEGDFSAGGEVVTIVHK